MQAPRSVRGLLTQTEFKACSEPRSCRSGMGMVFGRRGTVGFVMKNKTNACVTPWVNHGAVLTRGVAAMCWEMSDYKLLSFPSSAEGWLIHLPESELTVVVWWGGSGGHILLCNWIQVSDCSVTDMKTTWQGSLDDLLIFTLCFKKQKLTGDLPPALSLRGYARFKLPYSYCVNYTACLATWLNLDKGEVSYRIYYMSRHKWFPGGASGKEPAYRCRRCKKLGFNPWVRKIP